MKLFFLFFLLGVISVVVETQTTKITIANTTTLKSTSKTTGNPGTTVRKTPITLTTAKIPILQTPVNLCMDRFANSVNGTINPTVNGIGKWQCSFFIDAPPNNLIQLTCPVVNLNSSDSALVVYGGTEINVSPPVVNRIYTSRDNRIFLFSRVDNKDWFNCQWTMIPTTITTQYKLCRDGKSTSSSGTIERLEENTKDPRTCMFTITVPSDRRIQFSCSNVNLTSSGSYLQFQGMSETLIADPPQVNQIYISDNNSISIFTQFSNQDWFKCEWKTALTQPPTSEFKLCVDRLATSNSGNIKPLMIASNSSTNNQPIMCSLAIQAPPGLVTEISCPTINFTNPGSYLQLHGTQDLNIVRKPVANRIYTSGVSVLHLNSLIATNQDFFECKWSSILSPPTTDFKLCRHKNTVSPSGTIQPFIDQLKTGEPRECNFYIVLPADKKVAFSCSVLNMTSPGSYLQLVGVFDFDVNPLMENGIYFSKGNYMFLYSQFNNADWFNCSWSATSLNVATLVA